MAIDIASWSLAGVAAFVGALMYRQAGFAFSAAAPGHVAPRCRGAADAGPLPISGTVTLEICALRNFALNSANIVALALLLGGIAFTVYDIMAWRTGKTGLQSAFDPRRDLQRHDQRHCIGGINRI